ncbi:MAG: molecular chaperone DnaK [Candidatus Marsarchaeota archaeon]|nr:molecular chaperone DnaK [Candidatus Marsarchaeota archaeon]
MAKTIGIDLGTSNSAAAVLQGGRPVLIPSAEGTSLYGKSFPSYVAFTRDGQRIVGEPARRQAVANTEGTAAAFKRKMGSSYKYKILGKEYTPQELSAILLQKIKQDAEAFLGEEVKEAVITVPAYFNDNQRQATKDAGEIAGLKVTRLVNEPTAAALAYGLDKTSQEQKILVYDFGGGTLDVTVMEFGNGVFEVKSTSGDTQLGGTDMDNVLVDFLKDEIKRKVNLDISKDAQALQRVREAAERAKIELSTTLSSEINLPFLGSVGGKPINFSHQLTRAKLEELVMPIVERTRAPMQQALRDAKLEPSHIDRVILVGGPTRMPIVQRYVEQLYGKKIERGVDPMEAVAFGAAIQAGVLTGEVKDIVLLDVTPLSLGLETLGGVSTVLIPRNTTVPIRKSQVFSTADDNQQAVDINILQGERPMAKDNVTLGKFMLTGILPAPRGLPQIEVTFDIDANGILHVNAKDKKTGKEQGMQVVAPNKMAREDIDKKVKEAEDYAAQDKQELEQAQTRNDAETLVYSAEKMLKENKEKIPKDMYQKADGAREELQKALEKGDVSEIKVKLETLKSSLQEIGASVYGQGGQGQQGPHGPQGPQPGPGPEQGPASGGADSADANFRG